MADTITLNSGSGGAVLGTDEVTIATVLQHVQRVKLVDGADGGTALIGGDATNGLDVDVTRLPALVAGTANIGDVDVLTVPAPLSTTGGGTEAAALRVTLANDSTGLVSVDDNAGSLTVDGTVTVNQGTSAATAWEVTGDVAADAPVPANPLTTGGRASAAAPANVSAGGDAVFSWHLLNGAQAVNVTAAGALIAGDAANGLDVDVTRLPALVAGTANIGDVDVLTLPGSAHDAAVSGNPVRIAGKANLNEPTAVSTDGDTADVWVDLLGRVVTIVGHPNPEAPVPINATASGDTTVIAAPGVSLSLYILKASVHNRAAANRVVALREGAAGTIRWRAEIANEGGGSLIDFGSRGWKIAANTALTVNLDAAGDVDINVTEHYIAA